MTGYDMVLARPGYNKKFKRDVTWDELRKTFLLYKRIPLIVAGGSHYGPIDPNMAVGFVDAKIDEEQQTIRGEGILFKERYDDIPQEIHRKLTIGEHVHASLGYQEYDGIRKPDHILIGAERPVFEDIGFHAEAENSFHYEETDGINPEDRVDEQEEEAPQAVPSLSQEQLDYIVVQLADRLSPPEQKDTEVKDVEETEAPQTEPEQEPKHEEPEAAKPKVTPERKPVPKETPTAQGDGIFQQVGSSRVISLQPGEGFRTKEKTT